MKGITPVIAIILLLLITISMVGFAFVWFSRVTQSATTSGTAQMQGVVDNSQKRVTLESVVNGKAYVRISGTAPVAQTELSFYDCGGAGCSLALDTTAGAWRMSDCLVGSPAPATLAVNTLYCFASVSVICPTGKVRVMAPGGFDETTC
jgi:flagellin-like protein